MNAHSNFSKSRKVGATERRLRSKAFRNGFRDGFGATALFSAPVSHFRASSVDASVASAWKAVSDALGVAYEGETENLGKASRKTIAAD